VKVDLTDIEQLDTSTFPQIDQRYNAWFYLKSVEQSSQHLLLNYMIINVPTKNTLVETPTFDIKKSDGTWLTIPEIEVSIGPSLATSNDPSNITPKADIEPTMIDSKKIQSQLTIAIIIALLSSLIWLVWHFGWKVKNRRPFAQAVHDLSRFKLHALSEEQATRVLHAAFNSTAGTTIGSSQLACLFEQHPWLTPLQQEIEAFFLQSEQYFFARNTEQTLDVDSVRKLAKLCRAKEMLS
jgi:mxaA protein